MSRSAYRRHGGAVALLLALAACDGNKPASETPGGADADDPGSRMEGREAETAAPEVAATPEPERLRSSVQDRDPEEEKKKMAESRKQGVAARKLLAKGRLKDAIEASRNALRIHEQNVDAMLVIAQAYFRQGKMEITLAVTSSALAVDEKIRSPAETSEIHNLRAFAYDKMGKSSLATESFKEAAQADDKSAAAWNNLGTRYLAAGDTATALGCFKYALELDANFPKAHVNNGAALRASGQVEAAEKSFVKALQLKPNYGAAYFNLGVLYLDADPFPGLDTGQRLNKAIEFLSKYQSTAGAASTGGGKTSAKGSRGAAPVSRERADDYIRVARKGIEREQRRKGREAKRGSAEADPDEGGAASVDDDSGAAQPASAPGGAPTPVKPGDAPTPSKPGGAPTPVKPGSGAAPASPTKPAPAKPAPSSPAKPAPSSPTKPAPAKPAPSSPTKPAPAKPAPSSPTKPAPTKPAPTKPAPAKPAPAKPAPSSPAKPAPAKPAPTKPTAGSPSPVKPAPVKPTPVKPG